MGGAGAHRVLIGARRLADYAGGLAEYQRGLARELAARGAEVALAALEPSFETLPGCRLPARVFLGKRSRFLTAVWMRMAPRKPWRELVPGWAGRSIGSTLRKAGAFRPTAVHFVGTGWDFAGFGFRAIARSCGANFSVWPAVHAGTWGDDAIDMLLYGGAHRVFSQSHHEAAHLAARGLESSRILVCGLPPMCEVGGDGARLRSRLGIGAAPTALFLGRRERAKGFDAFLEAWAQVRASFPEARALVAGPGGRPADGLGILDLGIVDEQTKSDALAACDVFCLPSEQESFGIVYAEAWSHAKPVICGTAPASREWIRDGETGLWSDSSPGSVARCLVRLFSDPGLRLRLGRAGQDFQRRRLTWEMVVEEHWRAFGRDG